jgi:predicted  nucleic acid-binding Zn-ribbon protein
MENGMYIYENKEMVLEGKVKELEKEIKNLKDKIAELEYSLENIEPSDNSELLHKIYVYIKQVLHINIRYDELLEFVENCPSD